MDRETVEQETIQEEIIQEIIQPPLIKTFYKKWWFWAIAAGVIVLIIALFASGDDVQDDLLDYINNDIVEIAELETEVNELYEEARSSSNDYILYQSLMDNIIPKSKKLIEKAEAVEIETDEVREVHELYLDAINKQDQAFTLMLSALENQDYAIVTQANEKLDEARKLMRDYQSALKKLAKEHDVELYDK